MTRVPVADGGQALPGWLELEDGGRLFHWLHRPAAPGKLGVLLAGPIGPEYMHCHRAIKRLAESLAADGVTCLRFDPLAYGNSDGAPFDDALVDRWRETPRQLAHQLRALAGCERVGLVALRSAALLADRVLADDGAVDSLVYWYPYTRGEAFLRDMEMIDQLIDSREADRSFVNAGGYPLADETVSALAESRVGEFEHRVRRALILRAGDGAARPGRLQRRLSEQGIECRELGSAALPKMARQAELSELPSDDIDAITRWLAEDGAPRGVDPLPGWPRQTLHSGDGYVETIVRLESPRPLFGVLCESAAGDDRQRPLILLTNVGAGHHVGANRLNVDLARGLAAAGFASLRFDLANLGDSPAPGSDDDNHPYAAAAVDDIDALLGEIEGRGGTRSFVIAGLCSGAYHAFHAQLRLVDRDIVETLLINPLTFYLRAGESILEPDAARDALRQDYYREQARDWRTWLRLLGRPRKVLAITSFVLAAAARKLGRLAEPLAVRAGLAEAAPLARDIEALLARRRRLTFIVSARDPGYRMIMGEAGRTIRAGRASGQIAVERPAGTDHTFSTLGSRRELIELVLGHLESRYPAGGQAGEQREVLAK